MNVLTIAFHKFPPDLAIKLEHLSRHHTYQVLRLQSIPSYKTDTMVVNDHEQMYFSIPVRNEDL